MKQFLLWPPVRFVTDLVEIYFEKRVSRSAAELAYFLILSFFPLLICVNYFIGQLDLDPNTLVEAVSPVFPKESLNILVDYLHYISSNQSTALLVGGLGMTLYSASAAFRALMHVMADIYDRQSYQGGYGGFGGFGSNFTDVRRMIQQSRLVEAEELLDGTPSASRDGEWHYLKGTICYQRGWLDEARSHFSAACQMSPGNPEYRAALNRMSWQGQGGYGAPGHGYRQSAGTGSGMDACNCCGNLLIADCCCECMGGDLIPCC